MSGIAGAITGGSRGSSFFDENWRAIRKSVPTPAIIHVAEGDHHSGNILSAICVFFLVEPRAPQGVVQVQVQVAAGGGLSQRRDSEKSNDMW